MPGNLKLVFCFNGFQPFSKEGFVLMNCDTDQVPMPQNRRCCNLILARTRESLSHHSFFKPCHMLKGRGNYLVSVPTKWACGLSSLIQRLFWIKFPPTFCSLKESKRQQEKHKNWTWVQIWLRKLCSRRRNQKDVGRHVLKIRHIWKTKREK